jgi:trans-aconitate methyltransferase
MANATEINRAYYGRLAAGRENYWNLMPAPRMRIRCVVDAVRSNTRDVRRICDFGCGNGALLAALVAEFPRAALHGIDLSKEQIDQNVVAYPSMEWADADLVAGDYRYPFDAGCDVAVSSEVIEHLDRPGRYLENIRSSLASDGILVLTTQSGPVHATEKFVGHVRHWEAEDMAKLLASVGFRDVTVRNCGFPFHDFSKWVANLRPELTIDRFGERDWGIAERATAALLRLLFRFNSGTRGYQLVACAAA